MYQKSIPIFVGNTRVGYVKGDTFYKNIRAGHYLTTPPAIAFDKQSLLTAQQAGATQVNVRDTEQHKTYSSPIDFILDKGFSVKRGHGDQIALTMKYWTVDEDEELQAA